MVFSDQWNFLAAKFEKWAHIWCQLITKSDLTAGINFSISNKIYSKPLKHTLSSCEGLIQSPLGVLWMVWLGVWTWLSFPLVLWTPWFNVYELAKAQASNNPATWHKGHEVNEHLPTRAHAQFSWRVVRSFVSVCHEIPNNQRKWNGKNLWFWMFSTLFDFGFSVWKWEILLT